MIVYRVSRGGSWRYDIASNFRGAIRDWHDPVLCNYYLGFRLVRRNHD